MLLYEKTWHRADWAQVFLTAQSTRSKELRGLTQHADVEVCVAGACIYVRSRRAPTLRIAMRNMRLVEDTLDRTVFAAGDDLLSCDHITIGPLYVSKPQPDLLCSDTHGRFAQDLQQRGLHLKPAITQVQAKTRSSSRRSRA